jgi:hypothetical protein
MKLVAYLAMAVVAIAAVACGDASQPEAGHDVLYLRAGSGVAVVDTTTEKPPFKDRDAVPSGDWSTVVSAARRGRMTEIVATDPVSRVDRWRDVVAGHLVVNVVSHDGGLVALSPAREPYYRYGRSETTLVIAGRGLEKEQRLTVAGNFEPEAFSADGRSLFVISYLPARSPSKYQVRRLDLATGKVEGVFTPHAELQEAMGGTARIQTANEDGTRLYTLYTVKDADGHQHAFVHVLDMDGLWAHCIDLPDGFAEHAESSTALAVSPDGATLYVANVESGAVAEVDTETMLVERTETFDFDTRGRAHAAVDPEGTLYVTSGPWVVAIDTASFAEVDRWAMTDGVTGLQVSDNGRDVYVGLENRVATLNVDDDTTEVVDTPGIGRISSFGPVIEPVVEEPILKCAC